MENREIIEILQKKFPNAKCELNYTSTFELLVAVILSAQCTDKRVNKCTETLFKKYNTPKDFASLKQEELEKLIFSCGFYHNKAKAIISASKQIINEFNGEVPNNLKDLQKLKGVGRKTANVVFATCFGGDAIAVDTHVFRTSNRLGLSKSDTPIKCERDLMKKFDKSDWTNLHFLLVLFGRYQCKSQKPLCENCEFKEICKYYKKKEQ